MITCTLYSLFISTYTFLSWGIHATQNVKMFGTHSGCHLVVVVPVADLGFSKGEFKIKDSALRGRNYKSHTHFTVGHA